MHSVRIVPARGGGYYADSHLREGFIEGYHQAERKLELTNIDVYDIWRIYNEVCLEGEIHGLEETSQEVLKRFKDYKGGKEK